jgi:hypothetical protein
LKKKQFLIEPKSLQTHSQLLKASIAALREELWSEDDSDLRLFVAFHPPNKVRRIQRENSRSRFQNRFFFCLLRNAPDSNISPPLLSSSLIDAFTPVVSIRRCSLPYKWFGANLLSFLYGGSCIALQSCPLRFVSSVTCVSVLSPPPIFFFSSLVDSPMFVTCFASVFSPKTSCSYYCWI